MALVELLQSVPQFSSQSLIEFQGVFTINFMKNVCFGFGNSSLQTESIPVKVIDTVGAGDSFDAGFIYGYLNKWTLEKSLRLGCVCGALSTQQAGGTNGQPTLGEAMKYL